MILAVRKLDFVEDVLVPEPGDYIHVQLSPRLTSVLPPAYGVMRIPRSEFNLEKAVSEFAIVVERLQYLADTAQEQLRSAKKQVRNENKRRHYD